MQKDIAANIVKLSTKNLLSRSKYPLIKLTNE